MWARATPPRCASTSGWRSNDTANTGKGSRPGCKQYILLFSLAGWLSLCIQCHDELVAARLTHLLLRSLRGAGTIICTKLRQEYFKHEVRECSSSPDESCAGVRRVLPFGTLSL